MKPVSESLMAPIATLNAARALLRAGMTAEGLGLLDDGLEHLLRLKAEHLAAEAAAGAQK